MTGFTDHQRFAFFMPLGALAVEISAVRPQSHGRKCMKVNEPAEARELWEQRILPRCAQIAAMLRSDAGQAFGVADQAAVFEAEASRSKPPASFHRLRMTAHRLAHEAHQIVNAGLDPVKR